MNDAVEKEIQNALSIGIKIVEGHNATKITILELLKEEQNDELKRLYLEHIIRIDKSLDDKLNSVDDIEHKLYRTKELIKKQMKKEKRNLKKMKKREKEDGKKKDSSST